MRFSFIKFYCQKDLKKAHSAEADTKATFEILKAQLDRYEELENEIEALSKFSSTSESVDFAGRIILNEERVEVFNFGKTTDILKCRENISGQICLMGNIDPLDLMINGSAENVYKNAIECLSLFSGQTGYILSVGGGLNQGIPVDNIPRAGIVS